jgi:hypothetical protein
VDVYSIQVDILFFLSNPKILSPFLQPTFKQGHSSLPILCFFI